jgi:ribosomal 30S subunit maturation factor RimM
MREYSSHDLAGRWVLDERGRPLGEVVGIVHHPNGRNSLLVHSGPWRGGVGMLVPIESGVLVEGDVGVERTAHADRHPRFLERIGEVMWPPAPAGDR